MSIRDWFATFRKQRDAAAVERAEEATTETPAEQAFSSTDRTGAAADEQVARIAGETPAEANFVDDE